MSQYYPIPKAKSSYDSFFTNLRGDATLTDSLALSFLLGNNKESRETPFGLYRGIVRYASLQPIYYFSENLFATGGFNYRQEKALFSKRASDYLKSLFLELHYNLKGLSFTAAARRDFHSEFGSKSTYKVSGGYTFSTGTTLKASYGTGFKAPSLYQLYGPWVSNEELKAETSEGYTLGLSQNLSFSYLKGDFSVNYFKNRVWNLIDMPWWQGIYTYTNYNKAVTEGAELKFKVQLTKGLNLFGNYTHLRAKEFNPDKGSWEKLARRPKFTYTLGFNEKLGKLELSAWALHYSDREDSNGKGLGGFTTYNCYLSYSVSDSLKLYLKGMNLTDKDYELAYGYNTMGRALFVGASYSFK
jgi:vitamin B12 transporter